MGTKSGEMGLVGGTEPFPLAAAQALFDDPRIVLLSVSPGGVIESVNPALEQLTGFSMAELRGRDWAEALLPPNERSRFGERFLLAAGEAAGWRANIPIVTRAGENCEVDWNWTFSRNEELELNACIAIGSDTTGLQALMSSADETAERLQGILDTMFSFVGVFSLDGTLLETNQAPLVRAGLSRADVIGRPFWETYWWSYSPESKASVRDVLERARTGESVRDRFQVRMSETQYLTVDALFAPLRDSEGNITGTVASAVDVTRHENIENELQTLHAQLLEAQQMAKIGSWNLDLVTGQLMWSDEVYRIFEIEEEDFEASYGAFLRWVHPDDRLMVDKIYIDSIANHKPYRVVHRLLLPDGRVKWAEERGQSWYDDDDVAIRSIGTIQDITEHVRVKEQLRESIEAKETLLREVHHRVKNNLQVVSSLLYFQGKKLEDSVAKNVVHESRSRLRAMMLVHDELYQSKDLYCIHFDNYVRSLVTHLSKSHIREDQEIRVRVEAPELKLSVEKALPCGMIICELLINAFKHAFIGRKGGEVHVRAEGTGSHITVSVSDDGVGLPMDFEMESGDSFGWDLIQSLSAQIGGRVHTPDASGTTVVLEFPRGGEHA